MTSTSRHRNSRRGMGARLGMAAILALALAACAPAESRNPGSFGEANKSTAGTLIGGAAGGLTGSQIGHGSGRFLAIVAGTLLGGFAGHQVGESLDRADVDYARQAQQRAYVVPIGQQITWSNPQSGNAGTITPQREGTDGAGNYCREFQSTVTVAGKSDQAYGTACRQPDGSWKIVN